MVAQVERPELTPQRVADAEAGRGISHPLIEALTVLQPQLTPLNLEIEQIEGSLEKEAFIKDNYGMLVDAVEGAGDFTLEPEEMIGIWSKAVEVLPDDPRDSFTGVVILTYAAQGIDDPDVKEMPRTYFATGELPGEVILNRLILEQVKGRVAEVDESHSAIVRYFNVVDNPVGKGAELVGRIKAGDAEAQAEYDFLEDLLEERSTPLLKMVVENFGSELGLIRGEIQRAENLHDEVREKITLVISNKTIGEAEDGALIHPVVDLLRSRRDELVAVSQQSFTVESGVDQQFIEENLGDFADEIEEIPDFEITPDDLEAMWEFLMDSKVSLYVRTRLAHIIGARYAIQNVPNPEDWKGYLRYSLQNGRKLPDRVMDNLEGIRHVEGRLSQFHKIVSACGVAPGEVDELIVENFRMKQREGDGEDVPESEKQALEERGRKYDRKANITGRIRDDFANGLSITHSVVAKAVRGSGNSEV